MKVLKLSILLSAMLLCLNLSAQQIKFGGSAIYNFSTKGYGFGLRAEFPIEQIDLLEGISVLPQASYYPSFNDIHEFYIGSSVHVNYYRYYRWNFYGLLNLGYNGWINNENTDYREGGNHHLGAELGAGISGKLFKCWNPFAELRLNVRWFEPTFRIGITHNINCDRRGAVPCSRIPPQPTF